MSTTGYAALKNLFSVVEGRLDDHVLTVNRATETLRAQTVSLDNMVRAVPGTLTQVEFDILTGYLDGFGAQAHWIDTKYGIWLEAFAHAGAAIAGLAPHVATTATTAAARKKG